MLRNREAFKNCIKLRAIPNFASGLLPPTLRRHIMSTNRKLTARRLNLTRHALEHRGLASTGHPEQGKALTVLEAEREILNGLRSTIILPEISHPDRQLLRVFLVNSILLLDDVLVDVAWASEGCRPVIALPVPATATAERLEHSHLEADHHEPVEDEHAAQEGERRARHVFAPDGRVLGQTLHGSDDLPVGDADVPEGEGEDWNGVEHPAEHVANVLGRLVHDLKNADRDRSDDAEDDVDQLHEGGASFVLREEE